MCYLKQNKWIETRNLCDKVLEENSDVAKAYFRRGEALFNLNDHELGMYILNTQGYRAIILAYNI